MTKTNDTRWGWDFAEQYRESEPHPTFTSTVWNIEIPAMITNVWNLNRAMSERTEAITEIGEALKGIATTEEQRKHQAELIALRYQCRNELAIYRRELMDNKQCWEDYAEMALPIIQAESLEVIG